MLLLYVDNLNTTYDRNVSELVSACDCVIVQQGRGRDAALIGLVHVYDELVLLALVSHEEHRLLHVRHDHSLPTALDVHDHVRYVLKMKM